MTTPRLRSPSHPAAVLLMVCAATLWSMAGVLIRQIEAASSVEIAFWRSIFSVLFIALVLAVQQKRRAWAVMRAMGKPGLASGLMWAIMICCFVMAVRLTTVANTLIVMSISPLLTTLFAWLFLRQRIALRTWGAIIAAGSGMLWMFAHGVAAVDRSQLLGMVVALGVPVAASINVIVLKKAGHGIDLAPAVLLGGLFSALATLGWAWPFQASANDLVILAFLGCLQLGLPCMLMVIASRSLSAPQISLLGLVEVLLGPIWAWLGAGETPAQATLVGGLVVILALMFNEISVLRALPEKSALEQIK